MKWRRNSLWCLMRSHQRCRVQISVANCVNIRRPSWNTGANCWYSHLEILVMSHILRIGLHWGSNMGTEFAPSRRQTILRIQNLTHSIVIMISGNTEKKPIRVCIYFNLSTTVFIYLLLSQSDLSEFLCSIFSQLNRLSFLRITYRFFFKLFFI